MISDYIKSNKFKKHLVNWICVVVLLAYFFLVAEKASPFNREFSLSDLGISHPFATIERITDNQLYGLSIILATVLITLVSLVHYSEQYYKIHFIQISLLGLWLTFSITCVFTDILKVWIGRPRPDFLARCGPKLGTPMDELVDVSVCSAPLGDMYLKDGMKSCPSGHSSVGFSCLGYLSLWLYGQLKAFHRRQPIFKALFASLPLVLATYIALSRLQDYRHHLSDIILGSTLGLAIAIAIYHRFFNNLWDQDCDNVIDSSDEQVLPN